MLTGFIDPLFTMFAKWHFGTHDFPIYSLKESEVMTFVLFFREVILYL